MSATVMLAVLAAALLHAAWNVLVKASADKLLDTTRVIAGAALVAAVSLPFLSPPAPESWPYIAASAVVHTGYFALVAAAYRAADLGYVYPLMRGAAPPLTAVAAGLLFAEMLAPSGWLAIGLLSGGILLLAFDHHRQRRWNAGATLLGLANAGVICAYTLIDGQGVRLAGNAFSYIGWMFLANALLMFAWLAMARRTLPVLQCDRQTLRALGGGALTWASYAIALWAMQRAPIPLVAALRETSVIFGLLLAALFLHERIGPVRLAATLTVCAGAITLRLG